MSSRKGTVVYCPFCREFQFCRSVNPYEVVYESGNQWFKKDHEDIGYFRRGRECLVCGEKFSTVEIDEGLLDELVFLRDQASHLTVAIAKIEKHLGLASDSTKEAKEIGLKNKQ